MVATTPLSSWLSDPLHNQVTYKTCAQKQRAAANAAALFSSLLFGRTAEEGQRSLGKKELKEWQSISWK